MQADTRIQLDEAGGDGTVEIWSREGTLLKTFNVSPHSNINSVRWSPDSKVIATANDDNTVKLWNTDGRELNTLKGHNNKVYKVSFSSDGKTIASWSVDGIIKLWSRDGRELKTFNGQKNFSLVDMSFSPDGKILALVDNGTVILKSLDLDNLLMLGCDWLHGYLKNSPYASESDRHLCDGIGTQK